MLSDGDTAVALYARPRVTLGKLKDASVDICLRNYPEEVHRAECMRISRQHCVLAVDSAGGFLVQDLGSANGGSLDGVPLTAGRPFGISPGLDHVLDVAQVVVLRLRAVPSRRRPDGCAALVMSRSKNRPGLAYALVREDISIGGPGADLLLPGFAQGAQLWISREAGHWCWRPAADQAWTQLAAGLPIEGAGRRWQVAAGDPLRSL